LHAFFEPSFGGLKDGDAGEGGLERALLRTDGDTFEANSTVLRHQIGLFDFVCDLLDIQVAGPIAVAATGALGTVLVSVSVLRPWRRDKRKALNGQK